MYQSFIVFSSCVRISQSSLMGRVAILQLRLQMPSSLSAEFFCPQAATMPEPFEDVCRCRCLNRLQMLTSQNEKLRAARDLLLPRLMSGQIAV